MWFSIISYTLLLQLLFESYTTNYLYGRSFIVNEYSSIKKKKKEDSNEAICLQCDIGYIYLRTGLENTHIELTVPKEIPHHFYIHTSG